MSDLRTIAERLVDTEMWATGERFGALRMAQELGERRESVREVLDRMVNQGKATYGGTGLYSRPVPKHWLHRRRLANPVLEESDDEQ